jgi:hypothetical protein
MAKPAKKSAVGSSFAPGRKGNITIGVFEKEKDEFYETPSALTRALLSLERFDGDIWEPACGQGAMSNLMAEAGHKVICTDLVDRGVGETGIDFLTEHRLRAPNVVTNPPFSLWGAFAEQALMLGAKKVVLLNEAKVLCNLGTSALMARTGLARVLVATCRVKMLPPGAIDLGHSPRNGNVAWFVWEQGHSGLPTIQWFSPRRFGYGKDCAGVIASAPATDEIAL